MGWIEYQTDDGKIHRKEYEDDVMMINLSCRRIIQIKNSDRLTNLLKLNLSGNQINRIENLDDLTNLLELDLSYNHISRIENLNQLTNLRELYLHRNQISQIECLDRLTNLRKLYLSYNQISRIECLNRLTNLQELDLSYNQIENIKNLNQLTNLRELWLYNNQISKIECLNQLTNLRELYLYSNQIHKIECLNQLTNLQVLNLSYNKISRIENLDRLSNLRELWLYDNPIDCVPVSIMRLIHLTSLYVEHEINPIIGRFLARNQIKIKKTIYQDGQNVHDSEINRSITDSLYRLMETKNVMSEEMVMQEIIGDHILTDPVKVALVEYIKIQDVHSQLNVTFLEALRYVWTTVRQHKEADEIKRVMDQEMKDSICRCFTGRLSRLVNCLNGFDDRVVVKISDQQELANLIISIRQKTDSLEEQQQMVQKEMSDRGYDEQTIREWLGYLE
jgi:Leucine-rich repeat (LRR) protein